MNFCSDNTAGVHPKILAALATANAGNAMPYGNDDITARVEARLAEIFERECTVALVATGTAANALALATLVPAWGVVYCHPDSHINTDECGAPEFYTGGKLVAVPGADGRMNAADLDAVLATAGAGVVHHAQPAAISITQATEAGTVYRLPEIAAIGAVARKHKLALHMDGARFANALVTLGCSPADMTWRAGVDAVSFGCTKNGALAAEAIVMFDKSKAAELGLRRKRGGQLVVEAALYLGADRSLSRRRSLARFGASCQRAGGAAGQGHQRDAGREDRLSRRSQRDLRRVRDAGAARPRKRRVPLLQRHGPRREAVAAGDGVG